MTSEKFEGREEEYQSWLGRHPEGWVLNVEKVVASGQPVVHRASCTFIRDRGNHTATAYIKICADTENEVLSWAAQNTSKEPRHCSFCSKR